MAFDSPVVVFWSRMYCRVDETVLISTFPLKASGNMGETLSWAHAKVSESRRVNDRHECEPSKIWRRARESVKIGTRVSHVRQSPGEGHIIVSSSSGRFNKTLVVRPMASEEKKRPILN